MQLHFQEQHHQLKKKLKKRAKIREEELVNLAMNRVMRANEYPWVEITAEEALDLKKRFDTTENFLGKGASARGMLRLRLAVRGTRFGHQGISFSRNVPRGQPKKEILLYARRTVESLTKPPY